MQASMRDKSYDVMIELNDKKVERASCSCPRGQLRCHHMSAALIYARDHISSTEVACQWKIKSSTKDRETTTVDKLFPHPDSSYTPLSSPLSAAHQHYMAKEAESLPPCGLKWLLSTLNSRPTDRPTSSENFVVREILKSPDFINSVDKNLFIKQKLSLSPEQIREVEISTRGQRFNSLWSVLRAGRLTSSDFGKILRASEQNKVSPSLLTSLFGEYALDGVKAVQWGIDNEQQAVEVYSKSFNCIVNPIGLLIHKSGVLASSPDGIINNKLLEIKCPYKHRDSTIPEALNDQKFCIQLDASVAYSLRKDHDYYHQCQGQLNISGYDLLHFLFGFLMAR